MGALETFYNQSPVGAIDRNQWDLKSPAVAMQFRTSALYTPFIDWDGSPQGTGAVSTTEFELLDGEVDSNPIPLTANFIDAQGIDSRSRSYSVLRYGDKVQYHKSDKYFNMWKMGGSRDWRPLLTGMLGNNVVQKVERLSRNAFLRGPKAFWTYSGGAANLGAIGANNRFEIEKTIEWNLRVGNTGSPVVPGQPGSMFAIVPPGANYDVRKSLAAASNSEAAMYRDASIYRGDRLNYEIDGYSGIRFIQAPSDKYGINPNVLYNAGAIEKQHLVIEPIKMGDGAPDPDTTKVDETYSVGQKGATHWIQLEDFAPGDYNVNDFVTIHTQSTNAYGVTGGVDFLDGRTIVRRVIEVDATANRLTFDRPVMFNYNAQKMLTGVTVGVEKPAYAFVTKGRNIGFALVTGARGAIKAKVLEPISFYNPVAIDDFESVWRFSWDGVMGMNVADPNLFEMYFFNTSIPKPGGVI